MTYNTKIMYGTVPTTVYDGREVFELGGSEKLPDSTILKITSRMAKSGHVLDRLIMYVHALSSAIILCWRVD
jgi:hypothetical protein